MIGLLVGGTGSGVGKTTVTLAIIACLRKRGYVVQPYKGGPDFLDTTHHSRIAGRTARLRGHRDSFRQDLSAYTSRESWIDTIRYL